MLQKREPIPFFGLVPSILLWNEKSILTFHVKFNFIFNSDTERRVLYFITNPSTQCLFALGIPSRPNQHGNATFSFSTIWTRNSQTDPGLLDPHKGHVGRSSLEQCSGNTRNIGLEIAFDFETLSHSCSQWNQGDGSSLVDQPRDSKLRTLVYFQSAGHCQMKHVEMDWVSTKGYWLCL